MILATTGHATSPRSASDDTFHKNLPDSGIDKSLRGVYNYKIGAHSH